ncbi:hypothetical protein TrST_g14039 [Triparma strigata]|uniref:Uncharacterized protein n=1 Tax=Triparma strigata TaxID=1606541 RepID=A0A9W7AH97_9STRA|nr:hypothetical protein TrST_g14039 [Triparma strigata]
MNGDGFKGTLIAPSAKLSSFLKNISDESLQISEVSSVLQQILVDVELCDSINQRRKYDAERLKHENEKKHYKHIIQEYKAINATLTEKRTAVADSFFNKFITVAAEYEVLKMHKDDSSRVKELERRLEEAERMLRSKERRLSNTVNANSIVNNDDNANTNDDLPSSIPSSSQLNNLNENKNDITNADEEASSVHPTSTSTSTSNNPLPTPPSSPPLPPSPPPAAHLKLLDDASLFTVFSFLEAFDVLSCAQVDRKFFSRVDALFGFGSAVNAEPQQKDEEQQQQQQQTEGRVEEQDNNSTPKRQQITTAANSLLNRGLSLLSRPDAKKESQPPLPPPTPPLTSNFASSIADKLSASELKSIISLTERLKKSETSLLQLAAEKDDLTQRLSSVEDVKDFMSSKVSDLEGVIEKKGVESSLKDQQTKSDQEVIGFLDVRVRNLESSNALLQSENVKMSAAVKRTKDEKKKQLKILDDMLQFERSNLEQQAAEFKGAKKVLVREVKQLRANMTALRAERDSLRGELMSLREALNGREGRRSSLGN